MNSAEIAENSLEVPETREWVDEDGIRTVESYKYNEDGQLIKTTRRIRDIKTIKRIPMRVYERMNIVPFGIPDGKNEGVTIKALDQIFLERPNRKEKKNEKPVEIGKGTLCCRYCKGQHLSAHCPHKEFYMAKKEEAKPAAKESSAPSRKYVPPAQRISQDSGYREEEDDYVLRIWNVAEDVDEYKLRSLFDFNGKLKRLHIPRAYETKKSRGFAFAYYEKKEDAQAAIDMCNGYALNHLILDVSFYEKKTPTRRRLSGYGRYLPQNLKR